MFTRTHGELLRREYKNVYSQAKSSPSPIVRLRVHFSRHCDFNQLSDCSIITLFMLIHMKEETLRVIFQPSFSKLSTQGSSYRVVRTAKVGCTGSKVNVFCNFRALNKLFGPFKLILSTQA